MCQVLRAMPPPRRRLAIFKAGGYVASDMAALIHNAGLGHVLRLTNLMRKASCVLARRRWDSGRPVNLLQHMAAARKARVPFLLLQQLDATELVALLRPLLLRKRIIVEPGQRRRSRSAAEVAGHRRSGNGSTSSREAAAQVV